MLLYSVVADNTRMNAEERIHRFKTIFVAIFMYKFYTIVTKQNINENIDLDVANINNDTCFIPFYDDNICWN